MLKNVAIILASGSGSRFGAQLPKQFAKLAGRRVVEHTLQAFESNDKIDEIILVIHPNYRHIGEELLLSGKFSKLKKLLNGGATRQLSSQIALNSLTQEANVLIHDSARPFVSQRILRDCVEGLRRFEAVDVAIECSDTIIEVQSGEVKSNSVLTNSHNKTYDELISNIPQRSRLRSGQTPQCFRLSLIKRAHALAAKSPELSFTDDCGIVKHFNLAPILVVKGEQENLKITHKSDLFTAEKLFALKTQKLSGLDSFDLTALKDKVLCVFGGFSGIGEEICQIATFHGAKVEPFSRQNGVDVSDFDAVKRALDAVTKRHGRVDYVINSAGVLNIGMLALRDFGEIKREVECNFLGAVAVAKATAELGVERGEGLVAPKVLLFTSSSYTRGRELYAAYSASKAGVVNLAQALAGEGLNVNVINPERTATPMRFNAFGKEAEGSLLEAKRVAEVSLAVLLSELNGEVVDVKVSDYKK